MKQSRLFPTLISTLLVVAGLWPGIVSAESDSETAAHKSALDVAGAFSNDGFKLRDGHWTNAIEPGKTQLIEVNLYAGNQYWFTVAATPEAKKMSITIFNETGAPVTVDPFNEGATAAAGFAPDASGPYFVKIEEVSGTAATFCLIYSYK
jgi:hypothetical protein